MPEDEEGDDEYVYNPLKLPLGWDGKPIPYWLYKLHGLNQEFKCEICGNQSYWGRCRGWPICVFGCREAAQGYLICSGRCRESEAHPHTPRGLDLNPHLEHCCPHPPRRAFEKHFKEWRHQNGMRSLGIPNNKNFYEVTKIADAESLWANIQVCRLLESRCGQIYAICK